MDATAWKQPLVRGCLGALLLYAAVVGVLTAVLLAAGAHRGVMDALVASAIGGTVLTFGLLYWWGIRAVSAEARLVRQALREVPRVDGQRVAVIGTIEFEGVPLQAPFSGRECIAYWYEVLRARRTQSGFDHHFFFGWRIGVTFHPGRLPTRPGRARSTAAASATTLNGFLITNS